jgi:PadR family transcriptional regulator PadR
MHIENSRAQMRKGILDYCILALLGNKEAYPSEIIEELKQAELIIVEGTLYPLLTRLKNLGWLSYRWEESLSGPPRKYYKLTPAGQQILTEMHRSWDDLKTAIDKIRNQNTQP